MAQKPAKEETSTNSVETLRPYERLVKELKGLAKINEDNGSGFEIAAQVIDKMMEAETLDDILAAGQDGPLKAQDILHKPFMLMSCEYRTSDEKFRDGTLGVYVILNIRDAVTMADMVVGCGAPNVVAACRAMEKRGILDEDQEKPILCLRSRPTANGELLFLSKP